MNEIGFSETDFCVAFFALVGIGLVCLAIWFIILDLQNRKNRRMLRHGPRR